MAAVAPVIIASGMSFAQWLAKGPTGHLEALIAANLGPTLAPTAAPTVSVSGSGGSLAAGTYYVRITETNGLGETTVSPESTQFTVTAGQEPVVTFPALQTSNLARNVYLTPAGGLSGTEVLYQTGVTAGTSTLAAAAPTGFYAVSPPASNSTGMTYIDVKGNTVNLKMKWLRALEKGRLQDVWSDLHRAASNYAHGEPMSFSSSVQKLRDTQVVWGLLAQLSAETLAFVDANPGHQVIVATGIGGSKVMKTWP